MKNNFQHLFRETEALTLAGNEIFHDNDFRITPNGRAKHNICKLYVYF